MKAIRLVDAVGPNPAYDKAEAKAAKQRGENYDMPADITHKAGDIVDDPDCWILCVLPKPLCKPEDDQCKKKVHDYLSHPSRKTQLAKLKQMASPAVFQKLPKSMQSYVKTVAAKWLDSSEQPLPAAGEKDSPSPKK